MTSPKVVKGPVMNSIPIPVDADLAVMQEAIKRNLALMTPLGLNQLHSVLTMDANDKDLLPSILKATELVMKGAGVMQPVSRGAGIGNLSEMNHDEILNLVLKDTQ